MPHSITQNRVSPEQPRASTPSVISPASAPSGRRRQEWIVFLLSLSLLSLEVSGCGRVSWQGEINLNAIAPPPPPPPKPSPAPFQATLCPPSLALWADADFSQTPTTTLLDPIGSLSQAYQGVNRTLGKLGNGFSFSCTSSSSCSGTLSLAGTTTASGLSPFSISTWVHLQSQNGISNTILSKGDRNPSLTNAQNYSTRVIMDSNLNPQAGYQSGVFDGKFVYFIPNQTASTSGAHSLIARYAVTKNFNPTQLSESWETIKLSDFLNSIAPNLGPVAFAGGAFDGRYVYLVAQNSTNWGTLSTSRGNWILRYDTTRAFQDPLGWLAFSLSNSNPPNSTLPDPYEITGVAFDGTYLYLIPGNSLAITRIDTRITDPTQFPTGITIVVHSNFVPSVLNTPHASVRMDSSRPALGRTSYVGSVFDGRYLYFIPRVAYSENTDIQAARSFFLRFDTTQPTLFNSNNTSAWQVIDVQDVTVTNKSLTLAQTVFRKGYLSTSSNGTIFTSQNKSATLGYAGGTFDGRYLYFTPAYADSQSNLTGVPAPQYAHGIFLRYDTTLPFNQTTSWMGYDAEENYTSGDPSAYVLKRGYAGALFDGRYVYFPPSIRDPFSLTGAMNNRLLIFDTAGPNLGTTPAFANPANWTEKVLGTSLGSSATPDIPYWGGTFDGRFIYFSPSRTNSTVTRYDTLTQGTSPTVQFDLKWNSLVQDGFSVSSLGPSFGVATLPGGTSAPMEWTQTLVPKTLDFNTWYHLVATFGPAFEGASTPSVLKLFINGNPVAAATQQTQSPVSLTPNIASNLNFGFWGASTTPPRGLSIDEVQLFKGTPALNSTELMNLYWNVERFNTPCRR